MSQQNESFAGTSRQIVEYLQSNIGRILTYAEMRSDLNMSAANSIAYSKVDALKRQGHLLDMGDRRFRVEASIVNISSRKTPNINGHKHTKTEKKEKPKPERQREIDFTALPQLLPSARQNMQMLERAKNAQPIDPAAIMQTVIDINEQNRILLNGFEQIVTILEQIGIIDMGGK